MEPIYTMARWVIIPSLRAWFRWHVEGLEHVPASGPAIIATNHIAYLDPLAVAYGVVRANRRPRFLAKSELMEDPKIGWLLRGCGQIGVQRGTRNAVQALEHAFDALERGEVVCIFPEGTVTNDPELRPMPSKTGTPRLALRSGAPVIPCGVWGTANVWPKNYKPNWKFKQELAVRFGEPVGYEGDPDSAEDWSLAGDDITNRIAGLVASIKPLIPDRRRPRKAGTRSKA